MPVRPALGTLVVACLAVSAPEVARAQSETATHSTVRTAHPVVIAALQDGQRRSPTFRDLLNELDRFNAVVFLVRTPHLPRGVEACLLLWVGGARTRMLRIHVSPRLKQDRLVEVLGHELQHAVEALEDPAVVDGDTMRARFERIGVRRAPARDSWTPFETEAARDVGERIRLELANAAVRSIPGVRQ